MVLECQDFKLCCDASIIKPQGAGTQNRYFFDLLSFFYNVDFCRFKTD